MTLQNEIGLWLVGALLAVDCVIHMVREARITEAENQERGRRRVQQEDADIHNAKAWMSVRPVCPDCKTDNGRRRDSDGSVILVQDCMDVHYVYCHDIWHSAHHEGCGTYGEKTQRAALIEIGLRLRRG